MEHPNAEELVDFVYGELSPSRQTEIELHVNRCAECRETLDEWGQTRRGTANMEGSRPHPRPKSAYRAGAALGSRSDGAAWRGVWNWPHQCDAEPRCLGLAGAGGQASGDQLKTELARLAADQETRHQQDYQRVLAQAAAQLDARRQADYASLRRDMETVAVRTEERFDSMGVNSTPANVVPVSQSIQPNNR